MQKLPAKLEKRLQSRKNDNSFRILSSENSGVDFFSNDYLGLASSEDISKNADLILKKEVLKNGATGSRLLSGNYPLLSKAEELISNFHQAESALIFNSGYDANLGFFSSVPQKNDIILYDELSHASIRDGIRMSMAKAYKFEHNDLNDLEAKLQKFSSDAQESQVYIVTESVFSMDGDTPDLIKICELAEDFQALVIIDEAHATGVFGEKGCGLVQELRLENKVFARIQTFGKAIGAHGAAILGSEELKDYLINFARSFIYTTALSPHAVATIISAYKFLQNEESKISALLDNIDFFKAQLAENQISQKFINSRSAIQSCIISGNSKVKEISEELQRKGFMVKAILSPTVPAGEERLRFCLHSYNSKQEISEVLKLLSSFVKKLD